MARKTKAQAQETRSGILDAAEREFQQRGVSLTTLQDIAQAAGVTRGAVYWHFADKADLFNAMFERAVLPMEAAALKQDSPESELPLQGLQRRVQLLFERAVGDDRLRRVLEIVVHRVEHVPALSAVHERILGARNAHLDFIESTLARAGVPAAGRRERAIGLHAIVDGLLQVWMLDQAAFDLPAVGRLAVQTYILGLPVAAA